MKFLCPMKYKIFLFIFSALIARCRGANDGNCDLVASSGDIDWVNNLYRNPTISDTDTLNTIFSYNGIIGVTGKGGTGDEYIDVENDEETKKIIFKTTPEFANFDKNTDKQTSNEISVTKTFDFTCANGTSTLRFILPVKDTNNHAPSFLKTSYSYTMPVPLVPKIDLTGFGDSIIVEDIDFSNSDVTFSIDPIGNFALETISYTEPPKQYQAVLKVTEFTRLTEDATYTITATDSGNPAKTETATITIKVDDSSSLPDIPTFSAPSYEFKYSVSDGKPAIIPIGEPIIITTSDPDKTTVDIEENDYFTKNFDPASKEVTIGVTGTPIGTTSKNIMVLKLTVTLGDDSSQSVILVDIPNENVINIPTFSQPYYTATYLADTTPHSIALDDGQEISVTKNPDNVGIALIGDSEHFNINKVDNKWQLAVIKDLDADTLKQGEDIVLTLEATATGDGSEDIDQGFATLIINLPEVTPVQVPQFSNTHYSAQYAINPDGIDTVTVTDGPIKITSEGSENVQVDFEDPSENFKIGKDADGWTISVTNDLSQEILNKGGDIILMLQATVTGEDVAHGISTLIIQLPTVKKPTFSKIHYSAQYSVDSEKGKVTVSDGPIQITSPTDKNVIVTFQESSDYFSIAEDSTNDNNWVISVSKNLPDNDLQRGEDIILTLVATVEGDTANVGYGSVIIQIPKTPKFSKAYYSAIYTVDGETATVAIEDGPVEWVASDKDVVIVLQEPYNENFEFNIGNDPQITVKNKLADSIINEHQEILLTLQLSLENSVNTESTVISLKLPYVETKETLKFNQPSYIFAYKTDTDPPTIDNKDQTISITNGDGASVQVVENYESNFEIKLNDDKTYSLGIKSPLEDTVLNSEVDIILTLDASLNGHDDGFATVIINLPKKEVPAPQFTDVSYTAKYVIGDDPDTRVDSVTMTDQIILQTGSENNPSVVILAGTNSDNFDVIYNTEKKVYEIQVNSNLDDATLIKEVDIVLTLQASIEGTSEVGISTLVIKLPKTESPAAFSEAYYNANYVRGSEGTDTVEFEGGHEINLVGDHIAETKIVLTGDLAENFKLSDSSPYTITVITNLDDNTLNNQREVVLTLVASMEETTLTTSAPVIITLPSIPSAPKFSNILYTAKYEKSDTAATVTLEDGQITTDPDSAIVTVEEKYKTNFALNYDDTAKSYLVTVMKPLEDEVVDRESEIYVTLIATVDRALESGSATLLIKMPEKVSDVVPKFSKTYYSATYEVGADDKHTVTIPNTNQITIVSDHSADTVVKVVDTYADNFQADLKDNVYQLTVKKNLDDGILKTQKEIVVILEASLPENQEVGRTALIINLPAQDLKAAPIFTNTFYNAEYIIDDKGVPSVTVTGDVIAVKYNDENLVDVTLDDYTGNFKLSYDESQKQWNLALTNPLDESTLKDNTEIAIGLTAVLANSVADGTATLLVKLPEKEIIIVNFESPYYTATYTVDDKEIDTIAVHKDITINFDNAELAITGEYGSNFDIACPEMKCQLIVKSDLPEDIVKSETEIVIVLEAKIADAADKGTATVIIGLPSQSLKPAPKFSHTFYTAQYAVDDKGQPSITIVGDSIAITNDDENLVEVTLDEYAENFNVAYDETNKQWNLVIKSALDDSTLKDNTEIAIGLTAVLANSVADGTATLLVKLPEKEIIIVNFESPYYTATYTVDDKEIDTIAVHKDITINFDNAELAITGEYGSNFDIACPEMKCQLIVKSDLPEDIVKSETEIVIVLEAKIADAADKGTATVIIGLPSQSLKPAPKFSHTFYTAQYAVDDKGQPSITIVGDSIAITNDDENLVEVTLDEYAENFNVAYDETNKQWNLIIKNALDDSTLKDNTEIAIGLTAVLKNSVADGTATLLVKLPEKETVIVNFGNPYYTATYTVDDKEIDTIAVHKDITINFDNAELAITGEYGSNFDIACPEMKCQLTVKSDLPEDIVKSETEIVIVLEATTADAGDKGTATVIIGLPSQSLKPAPKFTHTFYTAQYAVDDNDQPSITIVGDSIAITNDDENLVVVSLDDYKENFNVAYDETNKQWNLAIAKPLDESTLNDNTEITIGLRGVLENSVADGTATLLVKLPEKKLGIITFAHPYYGAIYTHNEDADDSITTDNQIKISESGATVSAIGEYAKNFNVECPNTNCTLKVKDKLSNEILSKEREILIVLEASKKGITNKGKATVIISLPLQNSKKTPQFTAAAYSATYTVNDAGNDKITFGNESIKIQNCDPSEVDVTLNGDNNDFFELVLRDDHWEIQLKKDLSSDVIEDKISILLTLKAKMKNDVAEGEAAMVIELPKVINGGEKSGDTSDDNSGLIAAVAVLAVLLVAALVGSAVFYYIKFRRGGNYSGSDDAPSRFTRNSNTGAGRNKFEHPKRRPTGVIKVPLVGNDPGETNTEEEIPEKRKSVQFDVVNIDELEIETEKPDDDVESEMNEDDSSENDKNESDDNCSHL